MPTCSSAAGSPISSCTATLAPAWFAGSSSSAAPALGLSILGAVDAHSAAHALLWISVSIGGFSAAAPVGWSIPSLIARRDDVGKVGGIMNFSNQVSGIVAPIATGYLVTAFHTYAWAFGISAIYLVIGIAAYLFLLGKIEQMSAPHPA